MKSFEELIPRATDASTVLSEPVLTVPHGASVSLASTGLSPNVQQHSSTCFTTNKPVSDGRTNANPCIVAVRRPIPSRQPPTLSVRLFYDYAELPLAAAATHRDVRYA